MINRNRWLPLLSLTWALVASVQARPESTEPKEPAEPTEHTVAATPTTASISAVTDTQTDTGDTADTPPPLPATIARMIEQHQATLLGQGRIADLRYFALQAQGTQRTFLTSPDGALIVGRVYRDDGSVWFNTDVPPTSVLTVPRPTATPSAQATLTPVAPLQSMQSMQSDRLLIRQALTEASGPEGADAVWADLHDQATSIHEGGPDAPLLYVFIDAHCPYCHQQWKLLRAAISEGRYQVRWVPVAVLEASKQDIGTVLGLLQKPEAARLTQWMQQHAVERADTDQAKLALIRNNVLFKRLKSRQVPSVLYQQADGQIVLQSGLFQL